MQVDYFDKAVDLKADFMDLMQKNPRAALIFSRLHKEVIAIVPSEIIGDEGRYWVWLSSVEDGAYADGELRPMEEIARTLVVGGWNYQPKATMRVEVQ